MLTTSFTYVKIYSDKIIIRLFGVAETISCTLSVRLCVWPNRSETVHTVHSLDANKLPKIMTDCHERPRKNWHPFHISLCGPPQEATETFLTCLRPACAPWSTSSSHD